MAQRDQCYFVSRGTKPQWEVIIPDQLTRGCMEILYMGDEPSRLSAGTPMAVCRHVDVRRSVRGLGTIDALTNDLQKLALDLGDSHPEGVDQEVYAKMRSLLDL